jgi:hypothetical protein
LSASCCIDWSGPTGENGSGNTRSASSDGRNAREFTHEVEASTRDTNQLAKFIVDRSVGEVQEDDRDAGKNASAVARGRRGGVKGGTARAPAA